MPGVIAGLKALAKNIRKFNKHKDKKEKWMSDDLLLQINTKNTLIFFIGKKL